jgi:hypothetical protein
MERLIETLLLHAPQIETSKTSNRVTKSDRVTLQDFNKSPGH